MAVAFPTSTSATADGGGGGSVSGSVSPPSGLAAGDTWILVVVLDHASSTIATPSGFTAIHAQTDGDVGYPGLKSFYKIAGSSESAVTVSASGGQNYVRYCASIRVTGAHASAPIGNVTVTALTGTATTADAADVTIQNANSGALVIVAASEFDSTATFNIANPTGTTGLEQRAGIGSCFPAASVAYELRNSGSYAPGNFTFSGGSSGQAEGRVVATIEILPAATTSYSLACSQGSYTLTGQSAALRASRQTAAAQGSYSITGQATTLIYSGAGNKTLSAGQGSYAVTGQSTAFMTERRLALAAGNYSITGSDATGDYLIGCAPGAYSNSGHSAALNYSGGGNRAIQADQGSFSITGQVIAMGVKVSLQSGSYSISGQAAATSANRNLATSSGSYTLTGTDAAINRGPYRLLALRGQYVASGQEITLRYSGQPNVGVRLRRRRRR